MRKVWKWFDGKKAFIGALFLIFHGVPHIEQWIRPEFLDIIYYIGTTLGASSLLHRAAKMKAKKN
jgi:hypothetical protein